jgi:prophage endopeptidase
MMSFSRIVWSTLGLCFLALVLTFAVYFYRTHWHEERQRAEQAIEKAESLQQSLESIQSQQKAIAEIDKHHTQDLAKANDEIERLRDDVASGHKRLRIAATCPEVPRDTAAARVDDGAAPRLGSNAERDYFRLRRELTQMQKQLEGLQEYVKSLSQR